MNSFEELKAKAAEMELAEAIFLAADGRIARKRRAFVKAEFVFVDGTRLVLPRWATERPGFDDLRFKLRPSQSH